MNKNNFIEKTLSEIVTENYKYADIFEKNDLDFCCNGNVNFLEACKKNNIDVSVITNELTKISETKKETNNYDNWKLDFLVDYIVNNHHKYVSDSIPKINEHLNKIVEKHSDNHPELLEIKESFSVVYKDLQMHMMKEEKILFPYIKQMVLVQDGSAKKEAPYFGTVQNPIRMMEDEHKNAGDLLKKIKDISKNYTVPENGCNTYKVTLEELKEFEEDLHKHVHLENNILFPKSIKLEQLLFSSN